MYRPFLEDVYLGRRWESLSVLSQYLITSISREFLGIRTEFADSSAFQAMGHRLERLLDLLKRVHASTYVSGPSAKSYIDPEVFEREGIRLVWKQYDDYPEYRQLYPPFTHNVTILDLMFNVGPDAPQYIWGHRAGRSPTLVEERVAGEAYV
jgi:hypothetical protein